MVVGLEPPACFDKRMEYQDFIVRNVAEYLDFIFKEAKPKSYFRGQADKSWSLTPSLYRNKVHKIIEANLLHEANLQLWNEVSQMDYLSKLVFFQSYGLRTRLLDITSNALVALFFACREVSCNKDGGAVYIAPSPASSYGYGLAELYADMAFNFGANQLTVGDVDYFLQEKKIAPECYIPNDFVVALIVDPPANNIRKKAQSGAFIVSPILMEKDNTFLPFDGNLDDVGLFQPVRAIIPDGEKGTILEQLSRIGIDIGTMFPEPAHKIEAIEKAAFRNYNPKK